MVLLRCRKICRWNSIIWKSWTNQQNILHDRKMIRKRGSCFG